MCAAAIARPTPRYERDTIVISVEEDDMQVRLLDDDGEQRWHRRASVEPRDHTACGRKYDFRFEQLGQRMSRLEGSLCLDGCYTPFELAQALRLQREARKDRDR